MAEVAYSTTQAGYRAWIEDGNTGTFEDFLGKQAELTRKERLIQLIFFELEDLTAEELQQVLEIVTARAF